MSEKKMFTAEEVARMLLEKAHNTLKKHEDILKKSKNTAHEIDTGEEPNNDEAECPDSLKGEGSSGASKSESNKSKSPVAENEDPEMEDEPLSDDDSDEEESDEDESEESEEDEDEYEFKKSESGMHTVEYKILKKAESPGIAGPRQPNWISNSIAGMQSKMKKARVDEGMSDHDKIEARRDRGNRGGNHGSDSYTVKYRKTYQQKGVHKPSKFYHGEHGTSEAGDRSRDIVKKRRKTRGFKNDSLDEEVKRDKQAAVAEHKRVSREAKNIKPNLPKSEDCEYEIKKASSGMHTVEYKKLKKFGSQGAPLGSNLGSSIAAGLQGVKKEENDSKKENPQYHIRATQEGKSPKKTWTTDTRRHIDYSRSGMKGAKLSNPEDQKRLEAEAKERARKFKEESKK